MPASKSGQPYLLETPEGNLPFKPWPRTRSEASFSEFHYDNTAHPPAGVPSNRLNHHHSKDCTNDTAHISQVERIMRMTPEQESNCKFESLDGPRMDPATVEIAAGDLSKNTRIKVTLLAHNDPQSRFQRAHKVSCQGTNRGFILDVSRKAPAACAALAACSNPIRPVDEKFERQSKRHGYKLAESKWTFNECPELNTTNLDVGYVMEGLGSLASKMCTSVKGEKRYNVCGVEDMLPAATEKFTKGDAPPSARHIYENDRRDLVGFERGMITKGGGGAVEFLGESPEMWGCLTGYERPIDTWRTMNAVAEETQRRGSRRSLQSSPAQSDFSQYRDYQQQAEASYRDYQPKGSRASIASSQASVASSQRQLIYSRAQERDRGDNNRRSILSTPADSELSYRDYGKSQSQRDLGGSQTSRDYEAPRRVKRGSQTSRASVTSSQQDLARWR